MTNSFCMKIVIVMIINDSYERKGNIDGND